MIHMDKFTTSGIICIDPNSRKFLVMQSRFNGRKWSFPKGYINKGEDAETAALRELFEETLIVLKPSDLLEQTYTLVLKLDKPTKKIPTGEKRIKFYVAYVDESTPIVLSKEHSKYLWTDDFFGIVLSPEFVNLAQNIISDLFSK